MTYEMFNEMVRALCDDVNLRTDSKGLIHLTVDDFLGFDENWDEIYREFDDEDAVDEFLEALEVECNEASGDYYRTYYFDEFAVKVGYSSMDI